MQPAIEARGLEKRFGARVALAGVDLGVASGEIFGLVGPNGAGKSTFLRILVGVVRPSGGSVRALGHALPGEALAVRRRAGYLPGDANLYAAMRGAEFLRFAMAGYAAVDGGLQTRLVDAFELPLRARVRTYSHGMKRRLALVQALAPEVPLALLDEPTEGLDPTTRERLFDTLRELRRRGRTILFSCHDLGAVERICDRVAFLDAGRVLDCAAIGAIREKTARFLRVAFRVPVTDADLRAAGLDPSAGRDGGFLLRVDGDPSRVLAALARLPLASLEWNRLALDDLYADLYGVRRCTSGG